MKRKILYIKRGLFSFTNVSVGKILEREFSEYDLEIIDIHDQLISQDSFLRWCNWLAVLLHYFPKLISRTQSPQACFFRTPFIARAIHNRLPGLLPSSREDYLFSFQTSSMYDASIPGIPHFVYTDHTHKTNLYYPTFDHSRFFSDAWMEEESHIYHNALRVYTMSEHVRRSCIEHYNVPEDKVECIFAGSNAEYAGMNPGTPPKPLVNDGYTNKRISFIGVDWERKGGPELVEAFRKVLTKHPEAQLDVVGCSPAVDCPNVNVVGRVPLEEVQEWFCKCSVFCVPTKVEPFGIVFVEAFTHKVPVVSSNIGALPQIVEHGKSGFLCDPTDTTAMADHICTLLESPEICREFGEYGFRRVQEVLNWKSVGQVLSTSIRKELNLPE
jgi:glycosyltransferase involved in cell wall biosynthesis